MKHSIKKKKKKVFGYLPKVFLEALVPVSLSLLVTVFMI